MTKVTAGSLCVLVLAVSLGYVSLASNGFEFRNLLYLLLGVFGAIVANSTGAGGGVVFIPVFSQLSFSSAEIVATSFAIQCFGMTMGSLFWLHRYLTREKHAVHSGWQQFPHITAGAIVMSFVGISLVRQFDWQMPGTLAQVFGLFSVVFGVALLAIQYRRRTSAGGAIGVNTLTPMDVPLIAVISALGGCVTAWLSVGVGELLAIYLILRNVNIFCAVACAVVCSAASVWFAVFTLDGFQETVVIDIVLFAAPGALLGGMLARYVALALGADKLKTYFAMWIIGAGLAM